jgi:transcriptional regulator GlxA family with amidase domain
MSNVASDDTTRWIALVAFPDLTLLDLVGPLQILLGLDPPFRTSVVAECLEPILTDTGMWITPQMTFADIPRPDVIVVPGGPGSVVAMGDRGLQTYLRSAAETATAVASVCTGALPLAATGLLEGRRVSVHWAYAREVELLGARYQRARFTEDGKFITSAGVSAGIDMALSLAAKLAGREISHRIQLALEYDPQPPFGAIDWKKVGEEELTRQRQGGTGARLAQAQELLASRPDLLRRLGLGQ